VKELLMTMRSKTTEQEKEDVTRAREEKGKERLMG